MRRWIHFRRRGPAGPYATNLAVFKGGAANGVWSLYVMDDGAGDTGSFGGGWSMTITTTGAAGPQSPVISNIPDQSTPVSTPTVAVPFILSDADTPVANLTLSSSSSNPALVPTNNIVFGGSGSNRTVTVLPAAGQTGSTTVTVGVSDGALSASNSFTVTVTSLPAGTRSFTNATAIASLDNTAASPYPSVINVSGLGGAVTNVTLTLRSFSHGWGRDVEA